MSRRRKKVTWKLEAKGKKVVKIIRKSWTYAIVKKLKRGSAKVQATVQCHILMVQMLTAFSGFIGVIDIRAGVFSYCTNVNKVKGKWSC